LRAALGAGPRRLARQVLTECLSLAVAGGALGIPLGLGGLSLLEGVLPPLPYGFALTPDPPALAAAFLVALAVGLLFGIAPARRAASPDLRVAFQHAAVGGSRGSGRLHAGLIIAEVALSTVLLIAASLSIRTLSALRSAGGGSAPDHLLTVWTSLSAEQEWKPETRGGRLQTLVERVAAVPGIESAAATNFIPLSIINSLAGQIEAEGAAPGQYALCSAVSSGFFRTWGTPLVAGRDLTAEEGSTRSSAAVISETLARRLWPREPAARAVGRRLRITGAAMPGDLTVVGVAGDFKIESLREEVRPQVFVAAPYNAFRPVALLVRTRLPPEEALAAVRRSLRSVDPDLPLFFNATMEEVSAAHLRTERLSGASFALFGAIALLFAATGTYAVLAVGVARRRREIAVRLALGAPRGALLRRLIGRGMALTLAGLALGLLAGLAVSRALAGSLYGVTPTDPVSYAGVAILLLDVAFIACWLPARKAFEIEPAEALREE
jgi:predicted permease